MKFVPMEIPEGEVEFRKSYDVREMTRVGFRVVGVIQPEADRAGGSTMVLVRPLAGNELFQRLERAEEDSRLARKLEEERDELEKAIAELKKENDRLSAIEAEAVVARDRVGEEQWKKLTELPF